MKDDSLNDVNQLPEALGATLNPRSLGDSVGITYNERLIQQMPKDKISDFASSSVIAKEIWNAAIEAAACQVDDEFSNITVNKAFAANKIRRLKK